MPEGHTVHRMAKDHERWFGGKAVSLSSPQGRFRREADLLTNARFERAFAHGKHLFYQFTDENTPPAFIHIHLGLFGRFRRRATDAPSSPNCRLRIDDGTRALDLSGPTCCEVLTLDEVTAKRRQLGPDPLGNGTEAEFAAKLAKRRIPIGAALLDQKVIAGIGNIYRAELLFRHRVDPYTPANVVRAETIANIWETARWWLGLGVRANRIITVLDDPPKATPRLPRKEAVRIYGKRVCPCCGGQVSTANVGNRKLYFCTTCQTQV